MSRCLSTVAKPWIVLARYRGLGGEFRGSSPDPDPMKRMYHISAIVIAAILFYFATRPPTVSGKVLAKLGPGWSCEWRVFGQAGRPGRVLDVESRTYQLHLRLDTGAFTTVDVSRGDFNSVTFPLIPRWNEPGFNDSFPRWTGRPSRIHKHWGINLWRAQ